MIRGLAKLAVRNTLRRGRKSWVTIIGVFIGIAAVVSLTALGEGLEMAITQEFEELGADNIFVSGELEDSDVELIRGVQGVDAAGGVYSSEEDVNFGDETETLNVQGIDLNEAEMIFSGQGWSIDEGRSLRSADVTSTVVGPEVNDQFDRDLDIRSQVSVEGEDFRVVGNMSAGDPQAQTSIVVDIDRARDALEVGDDELTQVIVRIQPGFTQAEVEDNIEEALRRDRGLEEGDEDFSTQTPQDILDSLSSIIGVVQAIVVGLASIALLVGGIGIMNTMYMSINERTQEIGVLKAVGASERTIRVLFLLEAGLIGLIGGILGVVIGAGISEVAVFAVNEYSTVEIVRGYSAGVILGAVGFATLIGLVSGYLPARRASRLDPADALRYE